MAPFIIASLSLICIAMCFLECGRGGVWVSAVNYTYIIHTPQWSSSISQCLILAHLRASVKNASDTHHLCFGRKQIRNDCLRQWTCGLDNKQLGGILGLLWGVLGETKCWACDLGPVASPFWVSVLVSVEGDSWRWFLKDFPEERTMNSSTPQDAGLSALTSLQGCQKRHSHVQNGLLACSRDPWVWLHWAPQDGLGGRSLSYLASGFCFLL